MSMGMTDEDKHGHGWCMMDEDKHRHGWCMMDEDKHRHGWCMMDEDKHGHGWYMMDEDKHRHGWCMMDEDKHRHGWCMTEGEEDGGREHGYDYKACVQQGLRAGSKHVWSQQPPLATTVHQQCSLCSALPCTQEIPLLNTGEQTMTVVATLHGPSKSFSGNKEAHVPPGATQPYILTFKPLSQGRLPHFTHTTPAPYWFHSDLQAPLARCVICT